MMAAKNLTDTVLLGEGYQAEFKRTLPSRLKELTAEVCALANAISLYRPIKFEEWVKGWVEKLTKNRLIILQPIHDNSQISKREMETIVDISGAAIDNNIFFLKKFGLLSRQGGARGGRWIIHYIKPDSG